MSNYPNLPGVNMNVKDGQMMLASSNGGRAMLIIGEARVSPSTEVPEEPVLVTTEFDLKENFGNYFYQGEVNPIAAEWYTARNAGLSNIYLLGLVGESKKEQFVDLQQKLFGFIADMDIAHTILTGLNANDDVEGLTADDFGVDDLGEVQGVDAYYEVTGGEPATEVVVTEGESVTLTIASENNQIVLTVVETQSPEELVSYLNGEAAAAIDVQSIDDWSVEFALVDGVASIQSTKPVTVEGAEVLTALAITDTEPALKAIGNPAVMLATFAETQSLEAGDMLAYISASAPANTSMATIKAHIDSLVNRKNSISKYLQVVAGPQVGITLPGSLRTQWLSGVTNYAATVNGLAPQVAPTNQTLAGATSLRYNLSLRQLNDLSGNKYVTFRVKNGRIIVVDAVTTAPDILIGDQVIRSDFTRLSTLRTTNHLVREVREACDAFIGLPNEFPIYNSMNTSIKAVIKDSIDRAIIQDARYSIELGDSLDSSRINLTILPQFELRTIDVNIGLSTPSNFGEGSTL